jgi:hypothetical protein
MFIHPDVHLEIARQRHQDLLHNAERSRIAKIAASAKPSGHQAGRSRIRLWLLRDRRHVAESRTAPGGAREC